jgi:hypothetical protein
MPYQLEQKKLKRLQTAVKHSRKKLEAFRKNRVAAIRQYVGSHYGEASTTEKVPVNFIELATNIYTRQLAARAPRVLVTTRFKDLHPHASDLELAVNHLIKESKLAETMKSAVINALFGMGIVKIGMNVGATAYIEGAAHDVGQPFADSVDFDDWVHDATAKTWDEVAFAGNRFRLPHEYVMESDLFENKDELKPTSKFDLPGNSDDKAEDIGKSRGGSDDDEYMDYVELWELWLPKDNLMVTVTADDAAKVLRVVEWEGPENGPFHILGFSDVPNNVCPLPPVATWMDIHDLSNRIFRKLGRQAERQKTILGVRAAASKDGKNIVEANDGDVVTIDNPDGAREYRFGGVDQVGLGFFMQNKQLFSWMAGNLDSLGGLSAMSETVGQDQLLSQSASKRVADMQDRVLNFAKSISRDMAWYLWTDPLINLPLVKRVEQANIDIPIDFTPEDREGDFLDYNFDIEPYSMQDPSPSSRLQTLSTVFTQYILPFAPTLQQQGIGINFENFLRAVGKYANMPELDGILTFMQPQQGPPQPVGQMPAKSPVTTRNYVRTNRGGVTTQGKEQAMISQFMGQNVQPKEQALAQR